MYINISEVMNLFCQASSLTPRDVYFTLYKRVKQKILEQKEIGFTFYTIFAWKMIETVNQLPE